MDSKKRILKNMGKTQRVGKSSGSRTWSQTTDKLAEASKGAASITRKGMRNTRVR